MSSAREMHREQIDGIDREIIHLLARRLENVRSVGEMKRLDPARPIRDREREKQVADTWAREAEVNGLSSYFTGRVLRELLQWSRRVQEQMLDRGEDEAETGARVGYQGDEESFSWQALGKLLSTRSDSHQGIGFGSFAAVIAALEAGELDYALLPIENTIAGSLNEVYRLLIERELTIVDEEYWHVEQCLVGLPDAELERLATIRSHPVALQQCASFLNKLTGCVKQTWTDTAEAAASVADAGDVTIGAICSEKAARRHGLVVLQRDLADEPSNITRFVLLSRKSESFDHRRPARTSLVLTVNHRQGALASCIQAFARHGINLSKLESRPQSGSPWEYLFYLDLDGRLDDPEVEQALAEARDHCNFVKVLGCYPRRSPGEIEDPIPGRNGRRATSGPSGEKPVRRNAETVRWTRPGTDTDHLKRFPLAGRRPDQPATVVEIGPVRIGGGHFLLVAGPCAVESRSQIMAAAELARRCGAGMLRGGAFKPRSSPYSFQGLGFEGVSLLYGAGQAYEMPIVTEVLRQEDVDRIAREADVLQVGTRNMQNFGLLRKLGSIDRPVLLKRGMSATVEEWLAAAEYVMAGGNRRVILCERGIRTFEKATRSTLDVSAVPVVRELTHLPVIVDPSHAAGRRDLVIPLALAAVAAGADGLIVEAHPRPEEGLCDREQALGPEELQELAERVQALVACLNEPTRGSESRRTAD